MTYDPHHIIPRGARGAEIVPLNVSVRLMHDYDVSYMRDRVCADLFIDGRPMGIYARAVMEDGDWRDPREAIYRYGPDLMRAVLDDISTGLTQKPRVDALEIQISLLRDEIADLRRPWWRKVYEKVGSWMSGVR